MAKRTICIQSPAKVSAEKGSLCVRSGNAETRVPFEDIWVLIVESRESSISARALSELCDSGVGTMVCGGDHHPNGLLLPLGAHSRHAEIVDRQLAISKPMRKQLWRRIVEAKISNQASALDIIGVEGGEALRAMARCVFSGDASGREAVAAAFYFPRLLPEGGRRDGPFKEPLDYGYSILRAGVARCAVSGGWLVSRGIHHCNNLNAFNLVDDLVEPFRPMVDLVVVSNGLRGSLDATGKAALLRLFEHEVAIGGRAYTVQGAIERMLDSFKDAVVEGGSSLLELPAVHRLSTRAGEEG